MPPKTDATNTSPSTSASASATINFTPQEIAGIISASLKAQVTEVPMDPLNVNVADKY